jgi:redox-sensing transcriptional repressor
MSSRHIPDATVARLPLYLRCLAIEAKRGIATVSSERLAQLAGVNAAKVRKDLSHLGSYGTRGVGYDVEFLIFQVRRELGLTQDWPVAIAGAGNLGQALAGFAGFRARGFCLVAMFDTDPAKVGLDIGGVDVLPIGDLPSVTTEREVAIGIICTPPEVAQDVADAFVAAGVRSLLSFAPTVLAVPPSVAVRMVDLSMELQILSFHSQRANDQVAEGVLCRSTARSTPPTWWCAAGGCWWSAPARWPPARSRASWPAVPRSWSWRSRSATRCGPSLRPGRSSCTSGPTGRMTSTAPGWP